MKFDAIGVTVSDLDAALAYAFWGQRYAVVRDPDGNDVDLFAPLDAEET